MGDADIQISEDGSTITITWAHVSGMEVDTELWSKLVRDDVRSLWSGIEGVIPKEAVQGLQDFDAGQLTTLFPTSASSIIQPTWVTS